MSIDYLSEYEVLRVFLPHELSDLAPGRLLRAAAMAAAATPGTVVRPW